jgi:hypothetical protein
VLRNQGTQETNEQETPQKKIKEKDTKNVIKPKQSLFVLCSPINTTSNAVITKARGVLDQE